MFPQGNKIGLAVVMAMELFICCVEAMKQVHNSQSQKILDTAKNKDIWIFKK